MQVRAERVAVAMRFILCHGGSRLSAKLALATNTLYGTRDDYTVYAPPHFIDFNWKKLVTPDRWARYLALIARWRPYMAMCPDFEHAEQWQTLKTQILDVRRAGAQRIVITPKFEGALDRIPRWSMFVIGVSVPTGYAGFLPKPRELASRDVHLLGGAPDQWAYLRHVYELAGARVVSADGNFAIRQARQFGKYWSAASGGFVEMRGEGFSTYALAKASIENTKTYIKMPPAPQSLLTLPRVRKCLDALTGIQQLSLF